MTFGVGWEFRKIWPFLPTFCSPNPAFSAMVSTAVPASCFSFKWPNAKSESRINSQVLSGITRLVPYRHCSETERSYILSSVQRCTLYSRGIDLVSQKVRTHWPRYAKLSKAELYIFRQVCHCPQHLVHPLNTIRNRFLSWFFSLKRLSVLCYHTSLWVTSLDFDPNSLWPGEHGCRTVTA